MIKGSYFHSKKGASGVSFGIIFCIIIGIIYLCFKPSQGPAFIEDNGTQTTESSQFNILASSENKDLENIVLNFANSKGYNVNIDYAGTLEIMDRINNGEKYDSILISNSIWSYMIDSSVASVKYSKATSITPVIFGIKKSKAEELGFTNKTVYTKDLVDAISQGKLKFTMANPVTTNSGASAYLGLLYTLAGNPEVLTSEMLDDVSLKESLITFFTGLERSSGSEDFLEQSFLNGDYEAVFSYESSIIKINKQLEARGQEPLYAIYPVDGVSVCDNPFAYIDNKNEVKKKIFLDIQGFLLSDDGKGLLQNEGRRTWLGGVSSNVNKQIFNPDWGIDTTKYITPVKYPNATAIRQALQVYQTELRKPVHVVFCLDYSGSMVDTGIKQLREAMHYILTDEAAKDYLQFSSKDKIDVIIFSDKVRAVISTDNGLETENLLKEINTIKPKNATGIYEALSRAINILNSEENNKYNASVVLMTDGKGNLGTQNDLEKVYYSAGKEVPIYSIMFGNADDEQLEDIAKLSNGKVFDGKKDLVAAFREVRGYN